MNNTIYRNGSSKFTCLVIMKLTTFLIILFSLQATAEGLAQRVTLHGQNQKLETVMMDIWEQTGYNFILNGADLKHAHPVTLQLENTELKAALETLFRNQPFRYAIKQHTIVILPRPANTTESIPGPVAESERILILAYPTVSGRVVDSIGRGLAGASIRVLNAEGRRTTLQTKTGDDGYFVLRDVPEDAQLEISFVGYVPRTLSASADVGVIALHMVLSDLEEVEVMVNTGYQQLPKERSTGSFELITEKALTQRFSTDVWRRLEGVSSILFDEAFVNNIRPNHTVRGISSINGLKDPLIVVDNFPFEGDMNNLNPNDIESVTILKDAAAASIWGTRAGNGVIVITTKKATATSVFRMDFNSSVQLLSKSNVNYLNWMESKDIIEIEKQMYYAGYNASSFTSISRPYISPVLELLKQQDLGLVDQAFVDKSLETLASYDVKDQYSRYFLQQGANQQYHLTLKGGDGKNAYFFSGGYDKNVGNLDEKYSRLTLKSDNTLRPTKNLAINLQVNYSKSNNTNGRTALGSLLTSRWFSSYTHFMDDEGNEIPQHNYRQPYIDTVGGGRLLDWKFYPLSDYRHNHQDLSIENLRPYVQLQYTTPWKLNAEVHYQYELQRRELVYTRDENSYFTRDLINQFTEINPSTGLLIRNIPVGSIVDRSYTNLHSHNLRGQLNYSERTPDHEVHALAGAELRNVSSLSNQYRVYGYNPDVKTVGKVDVINRYKNYITGANSYIPDATAEGGTLNRYLSLFANAGYTYKSKYTVSGSMRRDASNLFGVNTNEKWQPMWSAGLSWDISGEDFYKNDLVTFLKLRATYGHSGNVDPRKSGVTVLQYRVLAEHTNLQTASIAQYANPELRWETIRTANFALDFRLSPAWLSGSIEYYIKDGVDLFGNSLIDYTAGIGSKYVTRNTASTRTNGIDLSLSSQVIQTKTLGLTSHLLLSHTRGKITDYLRDMTSLNNYITLTPLQVGKPIYASYSYTYAGLNDQGRPQGYLNGQPSTDYAGIMYGNDLSGLTYDGPSIPEWYGGWTNSLRWRGVELTINLTYKFDYLFSRPSFNFSTIANRYGHADYYERWQQPGDELHTGVPSFIYPNNNNASSFYGNSSHLVERGDHIRIQYIDLSYTLLKSQLGKLPFQSIQCRINTANLGFVWRANDRNLDPDLNGAMLPNPKIIAFGVNVNL